MYWLPATVPQVLPLLLIPVLVPEPAPVRQPGPACSPPLPVVAHGVPGVTGLQRVVVGAVP